MQGYENPLTITYSFSAVDFGAGTVTRAISGPSGKRGRVDDIIVSATETFTNTTTEAFARVGLTGDLDAYAEVPLGVTAAGAAAVGSAIAASVLATTPIPADTAVLLTCVAPTGGTPAGIGDVHVVVSWY